MVQFAGAVTPVQFSVVLLLVVPDAAGTGTASSALSVTTQSAVNCTTLSSAPTGLAASGTTSSSTTLNWTGVTAPANCTISGYEVYKGGAALATVSSGTTYTVTNLTTSTAYTFTVATNNNTKTTSQSTADSKTTNTQQTTSPNTNDIIGYW